MRRRTLVIGAAVLSGAALLLFCCAGAERHAEPGAPSGTSSAAPTLPAPAASSAAFAAPSDSAGSSAPSGSVPSSPPSGSANGAAPGPGARIAQAVKEGDPRDLELLANAERELKKDPPPELRALIAQRKRGASRDELLRAVQALPDLRLRVLGVHWLDEVAPAADAGVR